MICWDALRVAETVSASRRGRFLLKAGLGDSRWTVAGRQLPASSLVKEKQQNRNSSSASPRHHLLAEQNYNILVVAQRQLQGGGQVLFCNTQNRCMSFRVSPPAPALMAHLGLSLRGPDKRILDKVVSGQNYIH